MLACWNFKYAQKLFDESLQINSRNKLLHGCFSLAFSSCWFFLRLESGKFLHLIFSRHWFLLCMWVFSSAVRDACRKQGYGEELLTAAIQKCRTRNVQRITLHVDPLRTPAVNLYKKLGFKIDNLIEGYYSSDRNAYRMYLDFDASQWNRGHNLSQDTHFLIFFFCLNKLLERYLLVGKF